MSITKEQLEEIKKLAEAATPGPWARTHSAEVADLWAGGGAAPILRAWSDRNIDFIAAMREHALPLVKELREAWKERDEARAELFAEKALHQLTQTERDQARKGVHAACGNRHLEGACVLETVRLVRVRTEERDEARAEAKKWHLKYDYVHGDLNAAVIEMNAAVEFADNAKTEVERLRDVVRQVHALAEAAVRGTAVGAWLQTQEIHKITKEMSE